MLTLESMMSTLALDSAATVTVSKTVALEGKSLWWRHSLYDVAPCSSVGAIVVSTNSESLQ